MIAQKNGWISFGVVLISINLLSPQSARADDLGYYASGIAAQINRQFLAYHNVVCGSQVVACNTPGVQGNHLTPCGYLKQMNYDIKQKTATEAALAKAINQLKLDQASHASSSKITQDNYWISWYQNGLNNPTSIVSLTNIISDIQMVELPKQSNLLGNSFNTTIVPNIESAKSLNRITDTEYHELLDMVAHDRQYLVPVGNTSGDEAPLVAMCGPS